MNEIANESLPGRPRGFTNLSQVAYRLALKFAAEAKGEAWAPVVGLPLAAVIHAVVALEAFINEELEKISHGGSPQQGAIANLLREKNIDLVTKWRTCPQLLWGETVDAGAEPFQSFQLLVQFRNELVHYKPETLPWGDMPREKLRTSLRTKFLFRDEANAEWSYQILSPGCAEWACATARDMGRQFLRLSKMPARLQLEWTDDSSTVILPGP